MAGCKRLAHHLTLITFCLLATNAYSQNQKWAKCPDGHAPGLDIYKHYTGTVGSKKIVLELRFGFCGGSNYGGSTYYYTDKEGQTLFYIGEPDTPDPNGPLTAREQNKNNKLIEEDNDRRNDGKTAKWEFKISGNKLTGTWHSADSKETYPINLSEDYSHSYPLDLFFYNDANSKAHLFGAKTAASLTKTDADFISHAQINFLAGKHMDISNWQDYLKGWSGKPNEYVMFMPVYNDNNILVFEKQDGLEGGYTYLCLDVLNKKQLALKDIINADNNKLSSLLESAARKQYNLDAHKPLSTWFRTDKIPVTTKIMLVNNGINFCYNMQEIIPEKDYKHKFIFPDGPIKIFLSYEQLKGMMNEDFKKRVGM